MPRRRLPAGVAGDAESGIDRLTDVLDELAKHVSAADRLQA